MVHGQFDEVGGAVLRPLPLDLRAHRAVLRTHNVRRGNGVPCDLIELRIGVRTERHRAAEMRPYELEFVGRREMVGRPKIGFRCEHDAAVIEERDAQFLGRRRRLADRRQQ